MHTYDCDRHHSRTLPACFYRHTLAEDSYLSRHCSGKVFLIPLCLTHSPGSQALHFHSQWQEFSRFLASVQARCPQKAEHSSALTPTRLLPGLCPPSSFVCWERHKLTLTEATVSGPGLPEQAEADIDFVGDYVGAST